MICLARAELSCNLRRHLKLCCKHAQALEACPLSVAQVSIGCNRVMITSSCAPLSSICAHRHAWRGGERGGITLSGLSFCFQGAHPRVKIRQACVAGNIHTRAAPPIPAVGQLVPCFADHAGKAQVSLMACYITQGGEIPIGRYTTGPHTQRKTCVRSTHPPGFQAAYVCVYCRN